MADEGFGQQHPSSSAGEFNAQTFIIWQQLAKISTMKPVLVKAVDTGAKTVDVQPMVNQVDGSGNSTPHGIILGIPYMIWQFGKNALLADPVEGDIGLMVCADRDISAVKAAKAIANVGSERKMDAADGVYLGGFLNGEPEQWLKFTEDGLELADKNNNLMTFASSGITINGILINQAGQVSGNLPVTGNLMLGGNIVDDQGGLYPGNIHVGGTITGDTDVVSGAIGLKTHYHTAQGATAPTTAAQA